MRDPSTTLCRVIARQVTASALLTARLHARPVLPGWPVQPMALHEASALTAGSPRGMISTCCLVQRLGQWRFSPPAPLPPPPATCLPTEAPPHPSTNPAMYQIVALRVAILNVLIPYNYDVSLQFCIPFKCLSMSSALTSRCTKASRTMLTSTPSMTLPLLFALESQSYDMMCWSSSVIIIECVALDSLHMFTHAALRTCIHMRIITPDYLVRFALGIDYECQLFIE